MAAVGHPPRIGATSHRAKRTKQWTKYNNLITITQSPKLSDMNPIEKVWNFGKTLFKKSSTTKEETIKAILLSWDEISQEIIVKS